MIDSPGRPKKCRMTSITVPLKVVGDNFLIKMTSKGTYDVQDNHLTISFIRREILSPQPQGFFYRFDKSPNLRDVYIVRLCI